MNDYEKVKQCLEIINQNGDLYDAIALKEGVSSDTMHIGRSFIKTNILLFSRILYVGVMIYEKIRSLYSPIEKVRNAQNQIRQILGVNIDIWKPKRFSSFKKHRNDLENIFNLESFAIFYEENGDIRLEHYIDNLKKILHFCDLHGIQNILLREIDILDQFPEVDLSNFFAASMENLLDCHGEKLVDDCLIEEGYNIKSEIYTSLLILNTNDLRKLIQQLEAFKIDKKRIMSLSEDISDRVIEKAVRQFSLNEDLKKLRRIVEQRLTYLINSDSVYKEKVNGKVFQNVTIKGRFVSVNLKNSNGEVIGNQVMDLYDYLGILNYESLIKQKNLKNDNQELLSVTALHLYLYQCANQTHSKKQNSKSFYDYIYGKYQEKRKHKIRKIPGLYTKDDKYSRQIMSTLQSIYMTAALLLMIWITGSSFDLFQQYCLGNKDSSVAQNTINWIVSPYVQSFQYEYDSLVKLADKIRDFDFSYLKNILSDLAGSSSAEIGSSADSKSLDNKTGDASQNQDENRLVAEITPLIEGPLPLYYANQYAVSASYEDGQLTYQMESGCIDFDAIEEVEPLFSVEYRISLSDLEATMIDDQLMLKKYLYPVGNDYVITNIKITDFDDPEKTVQIYSKDGRTLVSRPSEYESYYAVLRLMEKPQVCCTYGISKKRQNSFVGDMPKERTYIEHSSEEVKAAIISGLGLESSASDYEIFSEIKGKLYSLTPIEDAHLSKKIQELEEIEFYKTIASLDSLICNMAAALAVGVDDDLIYTVGFYNSDDNTITESEAHAWAMNSEGQIVDLTPSQEKEEFDKKILSWGLKNHLPQTLIIALIAYLNYKLFGKRIKFSFATKKLEKIFSEEHFELNYAKLKEEMYGGTHIPISRDLLETFHIINEEFSGFTLEDLKELKRRLSESDLTKEELKAALILIDQIPFMREHPKEIQKVFQKNLTNLK